MGKVLKSRQLNNQANIISNNKKLLNYFLCW